MSSGSNRQNEKKPSRWPAAALFFLPLNPDHFSLSLSLSLPPSLLPPPPLPPSLPKKKQVYDVSEFVERHPGGRVLLTYVGKDATDVFSAFHAPSTWSLLRPLFVGDLVDEDAAPPEGSLLADFRAVRASLVSGGLFRASAPYYCFKVASTLSLAATAMAMLFLSKKNSASASSIGFLDGLASAVTLGLFWQQAGWLAHDFCHQQVFANRNVNNAVALFLGNVCQGFSVGWWKAKHNQHHAAPNELDAETHRALDPDIDTLPLIAWSAEMVETIAGGDLTSPMRRLVRAQHFYFIPVLLFARLAWAQQAATFAVGLWSSSKRSLEEKQEQQEKEEKKSENEKEDAVAGFVRRRRAQASLEVGTLLLHYAWTLGLPLITFGSSVFSALTYVLATQLACGLCLALVFVQSHNGMEVYSETKDFVSAQAASTRDISSTVVSDWFTGGLNYQLEHHLFPGLPRHNLGAVARDVKSLCEKHGLGYEVCSMPVGTKRVMAHLARIAAAA